MGFGHPHSKKRQKHSIRRWRFAAILSALMPALAHAHPGHDLREASASHLLTSPDHLAMLASSGLILWFAASWVQRRLPRRLLQFAGVAALAAAAVLWGARG